MLKISLIISILMLFSAMVILLFRGGDYHCLELAKELFAAPQSVLLIGGVFSAVIEDISS